MRLNTGSIIFISILYSSATAIAADRPVIFEDLDTNADGCISKQEAKVRPDLVKHFVEIDKDKSGTLCVDEYTAYENKGKLAPDEVEVPEVGAAPVK